MLRRCWQGRRVKAIVPLLAIRWYGGHVPDGRFIIVVFEEIDADTIRVITAYEVPEPKRKSKRKRK
jgi:hypothetical protein